MEPLRIKSRKKNSLGQWVEYEYWGKTWTGADGVRRSWRGGNCDVRKKADAKKALMDAVTANRMPTAESLTVAEWTRIRIAKLTLLQPTIYQYKEAARQAVECWGERKLLAEINAQDIEDLRDYIRTHPTREKETRTEPLSDWTVRNRLMSLSAMFAKALSLPSHDKPYLRRNPFDFDGAIPKPEGAGYSAYVTIEKTMELIVGTPSKNDRALVVLQRLMGMRLEEALSVEPVAAHIRWDDRTITVKLRDNRRGRGRSTKQNERVVEMSPIAYRVILDRFEELGPNDKNLIDRTPLTKGKMKPASYMRALLGKFGITVEDPNQDLRASCADDWSVLHGCELSAEWAGHSVETALKHYRRKGHARRGSLSGLGDPKAKLEQAYKVLEVAVLGGG